MDNNQKPIYVDKRRIKEAALIENINLHKEELIQLLEKVNSQYGYEEKIYRFYHHSFKVFYLQEYTVEMVEMFKKLLPEQELNDLFIKIIEKGTNKTFDIKMNENWYEETIDIVNAFLHAKYMLEMMVKFGFEVDAKKNLITFGWGSILHLYRIR